MIRYLQDLNRAGAAVFIALAPPCGAVQMRVLRRWDDAFPSDAPDDPDAFVVYAGGAQAGVLDWHEVVPGVEHWYAAYYSIAGLWSRSDPVSITPSVQTHAPTLDSLDVIRERVEIGLNAMVTAGHLRHPRGRFAVLTAPPVLDDVVFPVVAVHLEQATPEQHFIEGFLGEEILEDGSWRDFEGWRSRYSVLAESWSLNPDERRLLRRAMRDVLVASRDVLELCGIQELDVTLADDEDFQSYSAPMYRSHARLSYLAPDVVWVETQPIAEVTMSIDIQAEDRPYKSTPITPGVCVSVEDVPSAP